jgi:hypothetical protein
MQEVFSKPGDGARFPCRIRAASLAIPWPDGASFPVGLFDPLGKKFLV